MQNNGQVAVGVEGVVRLPTRYSCPDIPPLRPDSATPFKRSNNKLRDELLNREIFETES